LPYNVIQHSQLLGLQYRYKIVRKSGDTILNSQEISYSSLEPEQ